MKIFLKAGIISFVLILTFQGCSDNPASINDDEIVFFVLDNSIKVKNRLSRPIYYFAVERDLAARINWAPISRDENEIKPKQQKKILFEDIFGYEEGKQIIFYYWTGKGTGTKSIKSFVIDQKIDRYHYQS